MPELPEVEVVKRSLKKKISNLVIKKVIINTDKLRYPLEKKVFSKILNKKIISIARRAKYLFINLKNNLTILIHLGMTGKLIILDKSKKYKTSFYYQLNNKDKKHNHVYFVLNKNIKLIYNDVRKFGFIKILFTANLKKNRHIKLLGPEPLSKKFDYKYFKSFINKKNKKIKDILMDQKFVAGLGNIYVNEILFFSKLNPNTKAKKLSPIKIKKILFFTKKILKKSIKEGGSSIKDFYDGNGKTGNFQQLFNVYGRDGKECLSSRCYSKITKINISNRATFFCNICQK
ncbi:bifunctional DNA-formamidopyrimidine glycosylase/DNA-(apurinic or apyrimidinic site) lyase [Pelagibacteraceae bacterium]|nr:bifunctional DNA-formamidopyrimidine glycosylase/DNA-(apurinic or apyrimidinic site) lyase [Pelagibacteraceae bacterium]|tara:strand:+ start:2699 stop:3562 length:864 start_codon:yes stop_codon:yes gene_type:complete